MADAGNHLVLHAAPVALLAAAAAALAWLSILSRRRKARVTALVTRRGRSSL